MRYHAHMIDSHCHLADAAFDADRAEVVERAKRAGVTNMVCIADSIEESERCRTVAEQFAGVFWTVGVHPHKASAFDLKSDPERMRAALQHSACRAVGEIGLDYHYMNSPKHVQQQAFEAQLALAKDLDVPAVVHCREAVEDVWAITNHVRPKRLVIHCCTERWEDIQRFVDAGYFLSFTGIATYPKSTTVRECIAQCPLTQMMIETDAPYLAPVPHRGKRNEPAFVAEVAHCIAQVKQQELTDVVAALTASTVNFFSL